MTIQVLTFQGTDRGMLENLHIHHGNKEGVYFRPSSDLDKSFGIAHYAGTVFYHSKGFFIYLLIDGSRYFCFFKNGIQIT